MTTMQVEVLYFAALRELRGQDAERLELPASVRTTGALRAHLQQANPALAGRLTTTRFAVNERFVSDETVLADGDVVALIPPVAGGSGAAERVLLTRAPLSVDAVLACVRRPEAGALAVFVGVVRDHHDGKPVTALEYTAYESMAVAEMRRVVEELEAELDGVRLAVHHRIGPLQIGDDAVVCAASSAHRAAAFAGGRQLIDRIKERVPIWKRESGPEGAAAWVNWEV